MRCLIKSAHWIKQGWVILVWKLCTDEREWIRHIRYISCQDICTRLVVICCTLMWSGSKWCMHQGLGQLRETVPRYRYRYLGVDQVQVKVLDFSKVPRYRYRYSYKILRCRYRYFVCWSHLKSDMRSYQLPLTNLYFILYIFSICAIE